MKNKEVYENRKENLQLLIKDTQKAIEELSNQITKYGTHNITANNLNYIIPNLMQHQYKLATLEVELLTLNTFPYYYNEGVV